MYQNIAALLHDTGAHQIRRGLRKKLNEHFDAYTKWPFQFDCKFLQQWLHQVLRGRFRLIIVLKKSFRALVNSAYSESTQRGLHWAQISLDCKHVIKKLLFVSRIYQLHQSIRLFLKHLYHICQFVNEVCCFQLHERAVTHEDNKDHRYRGQRCRSTLWLTALKHTHPLNTQFPM